MTTDHEKVDPMDDDENNCPESPSQGLLDDGHGELMDPYTSSCIGGRKSLSRPAAISPWAVVSFVLAFTSGILIYRSMVTEQIPRSCVQSFNTDMAAVQSIIKLEERVFNGALAYNENGSVIREHQPGQDVWVGNPNLEMDKLWNRVEEASTVLLEGQEADSVRDRTTLYRGYWVTGLDVIHQMHCLNLVRKNMYPEHYKLDRADGVYKMHVEHCLDYIRQVIMCNSDISPVTDKWHDSAGVFGPDFNTRHTCKNFDDLLEWGLARTAAVRDRQDHGSETAVDEMNVMEGSRLETHEANLRKAEKHHGHGKK